MKANPFKVVASHRDRRVLELCSTGDEQACFELVRNVLRTNGKTLNRDTFRFLVGNHDNYKWLRKLKASGISPPRFTQVMAETTYLNKTFSEVFSQELRKGGNIWAEVLRDSDAILKEVKNDEDFRIQSHNFKVFLRQNNFVILDGSPEEGLLLYAEGLTHLDVITQFYLKFLLSTGEFGFDIIIKHVIERGNQTPFYLDELPGKTQEIGETKGALHRIVLSTNSFNQQDLTDALNELPKLVRWALDEAMTQIRGEDRY